MIEYSGLMWHYVVYWDVLISLFKIKILYLDAKEPDEDDLFFASLSLKVKQLPRAKKMNLHMKLMQEVHNAFLDEE